LAAVLREAEGGNAVLVRFHRDRLAGLRVIGVGPDTPDTPMEATAIGVGLDMLMMQMAVIGVETDMLMEVVVLGIGLDVLMEVAVIGIGADMLTEVAAIGSRAAMTARGVHRDSVAIVVGK
jgi:hypothetical protein